MDVVLTFLATVVAGIVAGVAVHIICKWLDNIHRDRYPLRFRCAELKGNPGDHTSGVSSLLSLCQYGCHSFHSWHNDYSTSCW